MRRRGLAVGAGALAFWSGAAAAQPRGGWILDIDYGPGHNAVSPWVPAPA